MSVMLALPAQARVIEYHAKITAPVLYEYAAPATATLIEVLAVPGQKYKKGDRLFVLHSPELQTKKNQLQLDLKKRHLAYKAALDWKNATPVQLSQLRLEQAKIQAQDAEQQLKNTQRLLVAQALTPAEAAREQQRSQQIMQHLQAAELEHAALLAQGSPEQVALLQMEVQQLTEQLQAAEVALTALTWLAPTNGWVSPVIKPAKNTACVRWQNQAACEAQQPFAVFIPEQTWSTEVLVDELDYPQIAVGSAVTITPMTDLTQSYAATVVWKSPLPSDPNTELGHYPVCVRLLDTTPLLLGQAVIVRFKT